MVNYLYKNLFRIIYSCLSWQHFIIFLYIFFKIFLFFVNLKDFYCITCVKKIKMGGGDININKSGLLRVGSYSNIKSFFLVFWGCYLKYCLPNFFFKILCDSYDLKLFLRLCLGSRAFYFIFFFFKRHMLLYFSYLVDIFVVDFFSKYFRFQLIYYFLSLFYSGRVAFFFSISEYLPAFSITSLYFAASWVEREIWDMFGIYFLNHPDLRRILTDYGFSGFPLRKDFPLVGFFEVFFDDLKNSIIHVPVSFSQEVRNFTFSNPWENAWG